MFLFTQIHEMIFYGNGGYDYETIYNMPIWLRKFTFSKIREHYNPDTTEDVVSKSKDAMRKGAADGAAPKVNVPTYITKANKRASPKK
jgi:hypothetical protein